MFLCIWNHIYVYDTRLWCWGTAHFVNSLGPKAGADLRRWPTPQDRLYGGVIKWKQFPRYWPFVRGILRSLVNFPHKGQWRGALMFSLIRGWIDGWVNNREAGDLRRHRLHYDVTAMTSRESYTLFAILLCYGTGWFYLYPLRVRHRHWDNRTIDEVPVK